MPTTPEDVKDEEKPAGLRAVEKAEQGEELSELEHHDATDWFLSAETEEVATKSFKLNVSNDPDNPKWVVWKVQALQRELIQSIRKEAVKGTGADAEPDDMQANLLIATEGTIVPDLKDARIRGKYADPSDALRFRLRHKPGLIDQIANRVIAVTGYDDDDVRKVEAGKA